MFLIENECKTPNECLTFIFYQKYFYDKISTWLYMPVLHTLGRKKIFIVIKISWFMYFRLAFFSFEKPIFGLSFRLTVAATRQDWKSLEGHFVRAFEM